MSDFFKKRDEVWDAYLGELERLVGSATGTSQLQFYSVSRSFPVDFVKYPKFSNGRANQEANAVTDFAAAASHPVYTGTSLTQRYEKFLTDLVRTITLKTITPDEQAQLDKFDRQKADAVKKLDDFEDRVQGRWATYKSDHSIPTDDHEYLVRRRWEVDRGYDRERDRIIDERIVAQNNYWIFTRQIIPPEQQALKAAIQFWEQTTYDESFPPSTGYENDPDLTGWGTFKKQTVGVNYDDFFNNPAIRNIVINESTHQSDSRKSSWSGSGGYSFGFFSLKGSGGGSSDESTLRDNIENIEISWQRLEEYPIARAPWFQPLLFTTYGTQLKGYWGPGGILPCYATHVIISRGLKISLHLKNTAKDTFNSAVHGGGGLSIGPFSVGGSKDSETHVENVSEKDFGFLIEDGAKTARVLAVKVERPNFQMIKPDEFENLILSEYQAYLQSL